MELRNPLDYDTTRQRVFDSIPGGLSERYPIENDKFKMELSDIKYTGPEKFSLKEQKQAILARKTLGRPLKGTIKLIDRQTGDTVDKKRTTLAKVPYMTQRGTFILGGSEYTVAHQMRLKPGVYSRVKASGELESHFNVTKGGPSFRVFMDPDSGAFKMQVGQAKLPLYPVLRAAGVTDRDMQKWWGRELFTANVSTKDNAAVLKKVRDRFSSPRAHKETNEGEETDFRALLENLELDPSVTQHTLGRDYDRITPEVLLRATQKLRNISSGKEDTDDRDSLMYQTTWGVDDLLKERVKKDAGRTLSRALWKATMRKNLGGVNAGLHDQQIDSVFFTSGMGQPLEEINTLDAMDQNTRITRMGEGGIPSAQSVPEDARSVQPSHLGFIDPVKTPECHSSDTDVMTESGWKPWPEVTADDRFACLIDGGIEYHYASRLIAYKYAGPMYGMATDEIQYLVTPEHRLYVRPRIHAKKGYHPDYRFEMPDHVMTKSRMFLTGGPEGETERCDMHESPAHPKGQYFVEDYDGMVYCATVPGGLLYTRRGGGIGLWSGNSGNIGVDTRIAMGAMKGDDNQLYTPVRNPRTGKQEMLNPASMSTAVIAFPNELDKARREGRKYVKAMKAGRMDFVKASDVDYEIPKAQNMFTAASNMVPAISGIKGGRLLMGAKYMSQALPLREAEVPLVQPDSGDGSSLYAKLGKYAGAIRSDVSGIVTGVTPDGIEITDARGEKHVKDIYSNFPLNRKTLLNSTPVVSVGQRVDPNSMLARSNFTDDKGEIAVGKNMRVGYMPFRGSVTKDTHILWYDTDGQPHFGAIEAVRAGKGISALTTDRHSLTTHTEGLRAFWAHNSNNILEVVTSSGRRVRATANHSFVELDDEGQMVERPTDALRPRESWLPRLGSVTLPVVAREITLPARRGQPERVLDLDDDFGFICGMYAAEGYSDGRHVNFAVTDPALRADLVKRLSRVFPNCSIDDNVKHPYVLLYSSQVGWWLRDNVGHRAQHKRVADIIFGAPEDCRRAFIAGFWAGDDRVSAKDVPTDTDTIITSRCLRDGLGLLFASIGISTTHGEYRDTKYSEGVAYRLGISGRDAHKFPEFSHSYKWDRLKKIIAGYKDTGASDHIPVFAAARDVYAACVSPASDGKKVYNRVRRQCISGTASRRDVLKYVPESTANRHLIRLRELAESHLEWDRVHTIDSVGYDDWVYDLDMSPTNTFVCVDTLVVHNSNYEDAIVISESAANKFTSEHMYTERMDTDDMRKLDKSKFRALFPAEYSKAQYAKIGDDGIARRGQTLEQGDPMILSVRRKSPKGAGMLNRGGDYGLSQGAVVWQHPFPGKVTDKWTEKDGVKVAIQAFAPAEKGDKLAGAYGDKGVISSVVPDDQMPTDADGKPLEVLLNPLGIISRINPSQIVEAVLGKVAEKRGKPYVLPPFMDKSLIDFTVSEMEQNGVSDTEDVMDPVSGKTIPKVLVGRRYLLKLSHTAESKGSDRALGTYSMEGAPAYSEEEGNPKRVGMGEMQALISHGAIENIKDIKNVKGQQNDDYWRAMALGYDPPTPSAPNAYKKFTSMLRAAGININKDGDKLHLTAMTDKDVDRFSSGEITNPGTVKWEQEYKRGVFGEKSMEPVPGGLFDRGLTGGHGGSKWSNLQLSEPMPNPVMEDPIRRVLGLTKKKYEDVIAGEDDIPGYGTGGKAIKNALSRIDVDKEITDLKRQIGSATSASARDTAVKKLGYMQTFKKRDINPADLVITKVPVLPPIFRPITATSKFNMVAGANMLYSDLMGADAQLAAASKTFDGEPVTNARRNVYKSLKAVIGLGDPVKPERKQQQVKGILKSVLGTNPKVGVFQRRLLGTSVDLAGRAAITPNPSLNMDQVGIPEESAWKLYGPFAVRRMVRNAGGDASAKVDAVRQVSNRTSSAREALDAEMRKRPVLSTRAPALHRYSLMAFKPVIASGKTLELPPAVTPGFNADFDGDEQVGKVLILLKSEYLKLCYNNLDKDLTSRWLVCNTDNMKNNNISIPTYDASTHTLLLVDLEDFPHGDLDKVTEGKNGSIEFYHAAPDTYVVAYDDSTGDPAWARVAYWSIHRQRVTEIVNLKNGYQIITDDDPRAVYGVPSDAAVLDRDTPTNAMQRKFAVPYLRDVSVVCDTGNTPKRVAFAGWPGTDAMPLNSDTGYWLGAMAGDGWWCKREYDSLSNKPVWQWQWHIADLECHNSDKVRSITAKYFGDAIAWHSNKQTRAASPDRYGDSIRHTASSVLYGKAICSFLSEHLGGERDANTSGSGNKRLPAFAFTAPREFREAMLCGLIDTDGTVAVSNSKDKPQLQISFTSTSLRLCRDIRLLCRTLGISATISFSKTTTAGNTSWILSLSAVDCKRNPFLSGLESPWKREAFNTTIVDAGSPAAVSRDMVPFPRSVADKLMACMGASRVPTQGSVPDTDIERMRHNMTLYVIASKCRSSNNITRSSAQGLVHALNVELDIRNSVLLAARRYLSSIRADTVFSAHDAGIVKAAISAVAPKWAASELYAAGSKYRRDVNRYARKQRIALSAARALLDWLSAVEVATVISDAEIQVWLRWVGNTDVSWTSIDNVEYTEAKEDGYDLTVPGYETFMDENGTILSNTMNFHVVVSDKAIEEANNRLLPSANIRAAADFKPMWAPRQEFAQGLYTASTSRSGKRMTPKMDSDKEVIEAYKRGDLNIDDVVSVRS